VTITYAEGVFYIEDTSRNGVRLNAEPKRLPRGERHALKSGDRLLIGPYEIRVSVMALTAPLMLRAEPDVRPLPSALRSNPFAITQDDDLLSRLRPTILGAAPKPTPVEGQVEVSAYCPFVLPPSSWQSFVVYAHLPSARPQVQSDSEQFFEAGSRAEASRTRARARIKEGAEIQIVPWLENCEFNPPRASVLWMEEWHRVLFRVRALPRRKGLRDGIVRFYVGPVLVGEISVSAWVEKKQSPVRRSAVAWRAEAYQACSSRTATRMRSSSIDCSTLIRCSASTTSAMSRHSAAARNGTTRS
jgi:FHA domain